MTGFPRSESVEVVGQKVWITDYGPGIPGRWHIQFNDQEFGSDSYWVCNGDTREEVVRVLEGHIRSVCDRVTQEVMES